MKDNLAPAAKTAALPEATAGQILIGFAKAPPHVQRAVLAAAAGLKLCNCGGDQCLLLTPGRELVAGHYCLWGRDIDEQRKPGDPPLF